MEPRFEDGGDLLTIFANRGEEIITTAPKFADKGEPYYVKGIKNYLGSMEGAANVLSGFAAAPIAGITGLAATAIPGVSGADMVRAVSEKLTYEPRTEGGKQAADVLNYPLEKIGQGIQFAGQKAFEASGSPALGTSVETGLTGLTLAAPALFRGKPALPKVTSEVTPSLPSANEGLGISKVGDMAIPTPPKTSPISVISEPISVAGDFAQPIFKMEVAPEYTKKVTALAKQFFADNPELRDPKILISDDVKKYVWTGQINPEFMRQYGLKPEQFAMDLRATASDAGKTLSAYSQIVRKYISPEMADELRKLGTDVPDSIVLKPLWRRLTDLWRASLVTQLATSVRNASTQVARLGLDGMTEALDAGIQKLTGVKQTVHPLDGFEILLRLGQKNKAAVDAILDNAPSEKSRMFSNYLSDVPIPKDAGISGALEHTIRTAESGVNALNIFNRTQEFIIRRAVFQARLSQNLREKGLDLDQIIKSGDISTIPNEAISYAVDRALHATFAESPAYGSIARSFVDFVNKVPGLSIAVPFPRFLTNAIKFQYQYSPLGILHYLSPKERTAFAAGDVSRMGKAIVGSALFGAAMEFRNSGFAGEKWYEAVNDKGEVIDLRPFNPFASYLFVADVAKRTKEGTLYKLTSNDIAQGLLSTNMRAGTGLYILDNVLNNFVGSTADEKKFQRKLQEFSGELASGFLTPLAQVRDIYDEFTEGRAVMRDIRQEPFLGPVKRNIPGVSQTLPPQAFPTREGEKFNPDPLQRQLTGLGKTGPKNALEKEIDRLGFESNEVLPTTGDPEIDRKYRGSLGKVLGVVGPKLVTAQSYTKLNDAQKGVVLSEAISDIRSVVRSIANDELPTEKQMKMEIKKLSPRTRILLKESGVSP